MYVTSGRPGGPCRRCEAWTRNVSAESATVPSEARHLGPASLVGQRRRRVPSSSTERELLGRQRGLCVRGATEHARCGCRSWHGGASLGLGDGRSVAGRREGGSCVVAEQALDGATIGEERESTAMAHKGAPTPPLEFRRSPRSLSLIQLGAGSGYVARVRGPKISVHRGDAVSGTVKESGQPRQRRCESCRCLARPPALSVRWGKHDRR